MKSNSKNFVDNRGGQLENCFHQREREIERKRIVGHAPNISSQCSSFDCSYPRRFPLSPENCTPNSSQFPYTNFHPYLSCLYRSYLFVHVSPHSNHGNERAPPKPKLPFHWNDRFLERSARFDQAFSHREYSLSLSLSWAMTKVNLHFSFSSNRIPFSTSSQSSSFIPLIDDTCFDEILINALQFLKIYLIIGYSSSNRL